jgi:NAD(P)-dependent dehydrogenase (short-subunit alcohol dehydrogenase family)
MRIFVTGSSSGLGLGAARALAAEGHEVIVHRRTDATVMPDTDSDTTEWLAVVTGDLGDVAQVRSVAEEVSEFGRLDAVIHNAGVNRGDDLVTVNVVAPYLLTALTPKPARLIYLSSGMHRGGSTELSRLASRSANYSDTKLVLSAFSAAVATRWDGTVTHAVDPGWVPTRMGGAGAPDTLDDGYETQVWLATHDVEPATGGYWHHRRARDPHTAVGDPAFQEQVLAALDELTGVRV